MGKKMVTNYSTHQLCSMKELARFARVLDGMTSKDVRQLRAQLSEATGTPREPKDFKMPMKWIPDLRRRNVLDDASSSAALRIAEADLNPRHFNSRYMNVLLGHSFLADHNGVLKLTESGRRFVKNDPATIDEFVYAEGCIALLGIVRSNDGASTSDLLPLWKDWLKKEAGHSVHSEAVLKFSVGTRLRHILIPLGLVHHEGVPRRYFITDKGVTKYENWLIDTHPNKERTEHTIAVENLVAVGEHLGYQTAKEPKLSDLMPSQKVAMLTARVFNKHLDAIWKTNLPIVGEIRIAGEVQVKGSIPDLLTRLKIVAPYCHYMIIVSDENQIREIQEFIVAAGDEKVFADKMIYLLFDELTLVRTQVTNISSKLRPAFGRAMDDSQTEDEEEP